MATETTTSIRCSIKLNDGTTEAGNVKTVSVNLATLNPETWNADKAINIANAASPIFSKSIYIVSKTATSTLSKSE